MQTHTQASIEYGTYFKTTFVQTLTPRLIRYVIVIPFPKHFAASPVPYELLKKTQDNCDALVASMPIAIEQCTTKEVENFKAYIKEKWQPGTKPPRVPDKQGAIELYHKLRMLATNCYLGTLVHLVRHCSSELPRWWTPDMLGSNILMPFLPLYAMKHENLWGAYYTAWKLTNDPNEYEAEFKYPAQMSTSYTSPAPKRSKNPIQRLVAKQGVPRWNTEHTGN